jgi:zinc protease
VSRAQLACLGAAVLLAACTTSSALMPSAPLTPTPDEPFRASPPAPLDVPVAPERRVERFVLANGLRVFVVVRGELPIAFVRYVSQMAGEEWASAEQAPLPELTAAALVGAGTTLADGSEMSDLRLGGMPIQASVDASTASLQLRSGASNVGQAVSLLARVVQQPTFSTVQPVIDRLATGVLDRWNQTGTIANRLLHEVVFGAGDRRALESNAWLNAMRGMGSTALRNWHARYRPETSALIVVGRVDPEVVRAAAERGFGAWKPPAAKQAPDAGRDLPPAPAVQTGIHVIYNGGGAPTLIVTVCKVERLQHPDYWALQLLARVLSGTPTTSAWMALRHRSGLAYNIFASVDATHADGLLRFGTAVPTERLGDGLALLGQELDRLSRRPVTDAELASAKRVLLQSLDLRADTNGETAELLADAFAIGDPVEVLASARQRVAAVTADELQQLAKRYLMRKDRVVLIIGAHGKRDRSLALRDAVFHTR